MFSSIQDLHVFARDELQLSIHAPQTGKHQIFALHSKQASLAIGHKMKGSKAQGRMSNPKLDWVYGGNGSGLEIINLTRRLGHMHFKTWPCWSDSSCIQGIDTLKILETFVLPRYSQQMQILAYMSDAHWALYCLFLRMRYVSWVHQMQRRSICCTMCQTCGDQWMAFAFLPGCVPIHCTPLALVFRSFML